MARLCDGITDDCLKRLFLGGMCECEGKREFFWFFDAVDGYRIKFFFLMCFWNLYVRLIVFFFLI